jgi:hypothetical protein
MNNPLPTREATRLDRRQTLALHEHAGHSIDCLVGSLWITLDGDRRDVVLAPGESFLIDRHGLTLVSALSDARFVLRRPGLARLPVPRSAVQGLRALFSAMPPAAPRPAS